MTSTNTATPTPTTPTTHGVGLTAIQGAAGETAGSMTWWSLNGLTAVDDLRDAALSVGWKETDVPGDPSVEVALGRAVEELRTKRVLPRQVKRGIWEVVEEAVVDDAAGAPTLRHHVAARAEVLKDGSVIVTPADSEYAAKLLVDVGRYRTALTHADISGWLADVVVRLAAAVGIRERGGIYFVPSTHVHAWRQVAQVLAMVSSHRVYEVPAMRTEEAVTAILDQLRREAEASISEMNTYLSGDTSTKGLNSTTAKADALASKVRHYAEVLGAALPDIEAQAVGLSGRCRAAKLLAAQTKAGAGAAVP